MVVRTNEHGQRLVVDVGVVSRVKSEDVTKLCIPRLLARMRPEDAVDLAFFVEFVFTEELRVVCLALGEKLLEFRNIVCQLLPCEISSSATKM